jgi:hypothetical protein
MAESAMLVIGSLMISRTGYMIDAESHSAGWSLEQAGNTSQGLSCSRRLSGRGRPTKTVEGAAELSSRVGG